MEKFFRQRIRETKFSNGLHFLFTDTRLNDGSTISLCSDITEIKQGQQSLKLLNDAIEIIPNMLFLWDKDHKLIMANKRAKEIQKAMGFDLKSGIHRREMLEAGIASNSIELNDNIAPNEWIRQRIKKLQSIKIDDREITEQRIRVNKETYDIIGSSTKLRDGGILQIWTDITEIRQKKEKLPKARKE